MSPPGKLYKYRSMAEGTVRERTLGILKNCELRYSPASRFNDPFDCQLNVALSSAGQVQARADRALNALRDAAASLGTEMVRKMRSAAGKGEPSPREASETGGSEGKPARAWNITITQEDDQGRLRNRSLSSVYNDIQAKRMAELLSALDTSIGVLCLSERPDDILLWSHYADNHSGLCLEFDVASHPQTFPRLNPVVYQSRYPWIAPQLPDLLAPFHDCKAGRMKDRLLDVVHVMAHRLGEAKRPDDEEEQAALSLAHWFLVKARQWKYEREWRSLKQGAGAQSFSADALTRVIVGCVDTERTLEVVQKTLASCPLAHTPVFKTVRKKRSFGLEIVPA